MVKRRGINREIEKSVELGRKNAALVDKVTNWCRHLELKMESAGLVAEVYGLPVGMMSISCEHASGGGTMSMHLNQVATSFVIENCRGCPHHSPISDNNIRHTILKEYEALEKSKKHAVQDKPTAKARLGALISGALSEALRHETITAQSILELVAGLDDAEHHKGAALKLVSAAKIASEFFTDLAVEVICTHFQDLDHGRDCISAIRNIAKVRGRVPDVAFEAAKLCILQTRNTDDACALIADVIVERNCVPEIELIDRLTAIQHHGRPIGSFYVAPSYDGNNRVLVEIGKRELAALERSFSKRLNGEKATRVNASGTISSLIEALPELAISMVDPLISSLELDDDMYDVPADGAACKTLTAIYVRHPETTQKKIDAKLPMLSSEAKEVLFDVYRRIVVEAEGFGRRRGSESSRLADACLPTIVPILVSTVSRLSSTLEVRAEAAETLESIVEHRTKVLASQLDSLLGILATVTHEEVLFEESQNDATEQFMERMLQQQLYGKIIRNIVEAIEHICKTNAPEVLQALKQIIARLNSAQSHEARYKSELTPLYGILALNRDLTPEIIPELFKLLMDFESVAVRRAAVRAVGSLLKSTPDALPQDMLEMLTLYLSDSYVAVHKNAARAMRYYRPRDREEAGKIAVELVGWYETYKKTQKDANFLRDLSQSLMAITRSYNDLLRQFTLPVIVDLARISDTYTADDVLFDLQRLLRHLPAGYESIFAREVFAFLSRSERERFNSEDHSGRYQLWLALFDLPRQAIETTLEELKTTARNKFKDDPWDALKMVQLLCYHEMYAEAAELSEEIASTQNQTKRNESIIQKATAFAAVARAEVLIGENKPIDGLMLLKKAQEMEIERVDGGEGNITDLFDTFAVADKIAGRLT